MAYIGKIPLSGSYTVLDSLTATTTDTYALTKNSVAVFPQTPANCIVSLNGVIQAPFDSYTISGSNIVFASALTASDSIDFITVLGDVLNVGTVSDNTITTAKIQDSAVTTAKIQDGAVSLAKLSATGTKDATTFLRGDNTFASAGGGKVLQVIQTVDNVQASSTSGLNKLSTSITPSATSSKVLIMVQANFYSTADHAEGYLRKGGSNLWTGTGGTVNITVGGHLDNGNYGGNPNTPMGTSFICYLDSPNTTSAITYDFRIIDDGANGQIVYWNTVSSAKYALTSSMTLMEIGA